MISEPSPTARATVRAVSLLLAALGAAAFIVVMGASGASAHSELVASTPADGAEMAELPHDIALSFNQDIVATFAQATLTDPYGQVSPLSPVTSGRTVTVPVPAEAATRPAGRWTLTYRVTSADGHPISGTIAVVTKMRGATPGATPAAGNPRPGAAAVAGVDDGAPSSTPAPRRAAGAGAGDSGLFYAGGGFLLAALVVVAYELRHRLRTRPAAAPPGPSDSGTTDPDAPSAGR